jgi:hypothetical protein
MGWYITIQQEMREGLGLKGNELIVFAFINGYSQEGQGCYFGSLANLQRVCGIASRQTAIDVLKSLIGKGYLIKRESILNGVKMVSYSVSPIIGQGVQKMEDACPKNGHNNKRDININNTLSNRRSHFSKPSIEEIREYCLSRNNQVDPEQFYNFYESKGWMVGKSPMKDWKASVRTWEKREKEVPQRKREKKESVIAHNLKVMDRMFGTDYYAQAYGRRQPDEQ